MIAPITTLNPLLKTKEIEHDGKKYICNFLIIEESLDVSIFLLNSLKYRGNITLEKIKEQIIQFSENNINEVLKEIFLLKLDDLLIINENDKFKLKIKFYILSKEKNLLIDLIENIDTMNLSNNDLINYYENIIKEKDKTISELKEIIKFKDEKIKSLEEQLKNNKKEEIKKENNDKIQKDNLYNDFNIKLKNPIHKLNIHTSSVFCLAVLNDGRLVSGSSDNSIIIYNKITYQPDIIIKKHSNSIYCITQLSSGILTSCSSDKTIKLFRIKEKEYEVLQTLNYHTSSVNKIIELKNKYLASCSADNSIIFYFKDNLEYIKDYKISTNGGCYSIIQTKENEICYSEYNNNRNNKNNAICFFDLNERKIKSTINNISKVNSYKESIIMLTEELLLIPGENKLSIINVNQYRIVRIIEVPDSSWIYGVCMLNKNMLLTGDNNKVIRQWRIEGDNLILISTKDNTNDNCINVLLNIGDGFIASGSSDNTIRIW